MVKYSVWTLTGRLKKGNRWKKHKTFTTENRAYNYVMKNEARQINQIGGQKRSDPAYQVRRTKKRRK